MCWSAGWSSFVGSPYGWDAVSDFLVKAFCSGDWEWKPCLGNEDVIFGTGKGCLGRLLPGRFEILGRVLITLLSFTTLHLGFLQESPFLRQTRTLMPVSNLLLSYQSFLRQIIRSPS